MITRFFVFRFSSSELKLTQHQHHVPPLHSCVQLTISPFHEPSGLVSSQLNVHRTTSSSSAAHLSQARSPFKDRVIQSLTASLTNCCCKHEHFLIFSKTISTDAKTVFLRLEFEKVFTQCRNTFYLQNFGCWSSAICLVVMQKDFDWSIVSSAVWLRHMSFKKSICHTVKNTVCSFVIWSRSFLD